MCLAQGPQHSDADETRTRGPLCLESSTLPLSHCAPNQSLIQGSRKGGGGGGGGLGFQCDQPDAYLNMTYDNSHWYRKLQAFRSYSLYKTGNHHPNLQVAGHLGPRKITISNTPIIRYAYPSGRSRGSSLKDKMISFFMGNFQKIHQ